MFSRRELVTVLVALAGGEKCMTGAPTVRFRYKLAAEHLEVDYAFRNPFNAPVLVYDRLWNMQKEALDPAWIYIEISGGRAILKRQLEPLPVGLHHENPEVPYGREIAPGAEAAGNCKVDLPLREIGPYNAITKRGQPREVALTSLEFHLGWSAVPDTLPPGVKPVEVEGQKLLLLSYPKLASIQHVATSESFRVELAGVVR
jgi:hypothetical protein